MALSLGLSPLQSSSQARLAGEAAYETELGTPSDHRRERGRPELTARNLMTAPAIACRSDAFFEGVRSVPVDRDISGMPVVDDEGRVVGVVSERDFAHR